MTAGIFWERRSLDEWFPVFIHVSVDIGDRTDQVFSVLDTPAGNHTIKHGN